MIENPFTDSYTQSGSIFYIDPNPASSRAVLLLHGLGADGSSWGYQFPALVDAGYRPLAPDLPGFGRSECRERIWSIRGIARSLSGWLDRLCVERVSVVGISMGGIAALRLALDCPGRVEKLVLANTFACLRPRSRSEMLYLLRRFVVANLQGVDRQAELVAQRLFPQPGQAALRAELVQRIAQSDPGVYRSAMLQLGLFDARRELSSISMPTLVITGEQDSTVPVAIQKEMAAGIPRARHLLIPGGGHAVTVEQPERFNRALLSFLDRGS